MTFHFARRNDRRFRWRMAAVALGLASLAGAGISSGTPQVATQAQAPSLDGAALEYEVASIKVAHHTGADAYRVGVVPSPDGLTATNVTLQILIVIAYGVQNNQIMGAGDFLNSEHYDFDAKMSEATAAELRKLSPEERTTARQHMLQALLEDRFKLKIHRETRELPVYALVLAKGGSKMKEVTAPSPDASPVASGSAGRTGAGGGPGISVSGGRGGVMTATGTSMSINALIHTISTSLDRPLIDKTGLTGYYDFSLEWIREDAAQSAAAASLAAGGGAVPAENSAPNIFTALQEQLGLKLEPTKGPVEVIVVDKSEKPSGN